VEVMTYKTEQESFWSGEFGDEYSRRNVGNEWIASNTALFSKILEKTDGVQTILEFGANIGLNLKALSHLLPNSELSAVEINGHAVKELEQWGRLEHIFHESILDFDSKGKSWDLALIKGVLIHINPDELAAVYEKLYRACGRYLLVAEYYNPSPIEVSYRGHAGKLFKRDFAGEILDQYPDLHLLDYGFVWHRDPNFPQDDISWFLMEKK
jgi:pseudaminic acid biosynthesis-associated methylase